MKEYWRRLDSGRLNRRNFLAGVVLVYLVINFIPALVGLIAGEEIGSSFGYLIGVVLAIIYWISLTIRRFHDIGKGGWITALALIPVVNIGILLWLLFAPGQKGENKYGSSVQGINLKRILAIP